MIHVPGGSGLQLIKSWLFSICDQRMCWVDRGIYIPPSRCSSSECVDFRSFRVGGINFAIVDALDVLVSTCSSPWFTCLVVVDFNILHVGFIDRAIRGCVGRLWASIFLQSVVRVLGGSGFAPIRCRYRTLKMYTFFGAIRGYLGWSVASIFSSTVQELGGSGYQLIGRCSCVELAI